MQTDYEQYERESVVRAGYCPCGKRMKPDEAHVCDECARLLLEGEVTERVRSESNG